MRRRQSRPVVTKHALKVERTLKYTATAGFLPLKNDAGDTEANVFFVAYAPTAEAGPREAPADVLLQRRARLGLGLAPPRRPRAQAGEDAGATA